MVANSAISDNCLINKCDNFAREICSVKIASKNEGEIRYVGDKS